MVRTNKPHWANLRKPQANGGDYWGFKYGSSGNCYNWGSAGFTLPTLRSVSSADRLHRTFPLHTSACSEMLRNSHPFTSGCSATLQLPNRPVYEDNLDDVFLPDSSNFSTLQAEHQRMFWEKPPLQRTSSQLGDVSWVMGDMPLAVQDRRQMQEMVRRPPSVVSTHTTKIAATQQQEATADMLM